MVRPLPGRTPHGSRTNVPLHSPGRGRVTNPDRDVVGEAADAVARGMGSPAFLGAMTLMIIVWVGLNALGPTWLRWDWPSLFLLNLLFSVQSSYSGPLIMMAQQRSANRDLAQLSEDRRNQVQAREDMKFLSREVHQVVERFSDLPTRSEVDHLVREELGEYLQTRAAIRRERMATV